MPVTIFYSWQSDTPEDCGTKLIEQALDLAIEQLRQEVILDKAVRDVHVDKDTKGVPGQPPIAETILRKIDMASIFLPDLTYVSNRSGADKARGIPNPNVLIEYGYALKSLTNARIVPVMNTHYGDPDEVELPFDIGHLRWPIRYYSRPKADADERTHSLNCLVKELKGQIVAVLNNYPAPPSVKPFFQNLTPGRFRTKGQQIGETYDSFLGDRESGKVVFADGPAVWLKLAPAFEFSRELRITDIHRKVGERLSQLLTLFRSSTAAYLRAADGFGIYATDSSKSGQTSKLIFISRSGEILAIASDVIGHVEWRGQPIIPDMTLQFAQCLKNYSALLTSLGISSPFKWQAVIEGTKGLPMVTRQIFDTLSQNCLEEVVSAAGDYTLGDNPVGALRQFTEKLYDSCGLEPPPAESYNAQ